MANAKSELELAAAGAKCGKFGVRILSNESVLSVEQLEKLRTR